MKPYHSLAVGGETYEAEFSLAPHSSSSNCGSPYCRTIRFALEATSRLGTGSAASDAASFAIRSRNALGVARQVLKGVEIRRQRKGPSSSRSATQVGFHPIDGSQRGPESDRGCVAPER